MKFAVALLSYFDNENIVTIVEAECSEEALLKVLQPTCGDEYVENLSECTCDEIIQAAFDGDLALSMPVRID